MVVIVGRPNTGKSTLFNRLVGGRIAITLQEPGITRDRIARDVDWLGRRFRVVDTGGLVPNSKEEIAREVERQVQIALDEANVIVLVVDGAAGLHALDEEIASRLRDEGRKFIVAVNKLDQRRKYDTSDFHKLGGEAMVQISAELGTGVDELLAEILQRLPEEPRRRSEEIISLAILGRPNVGKSSLMNLLLGKNRAIVTPIPGTTRDVVEEIFEFHGRHYRLLDTAGIRRKPRVTEPVEYYSVTRAIDQIQRCDVAIIVFDAFDGPNAQDQRIVNLVVERTKGMVLVANKMDLVPEHLKEKVHNWVKLKLRFVDYAPLQFASVLKGEGVDDIIRTATAVWQNGGRQVSNALLRAEVLPRLEKNQPRYDARVLGLSQITARPPVFRLKMSNPDRATTTWQRRVISEIRHKYGFAGYPIILRIVR